MMNFCKFDTSLVGLWITLMKAENFSGVFFLSITYSFSCEGCIYKRPLTRKKLGNMEVASNYGIIIR